MPAPDPNAANPAVNSMIEAFLGARRLRDARDARIAEQSIQQQNVESETEFRKNQAKEADARLEEEHRKGQHEFAIQAAQVELARLQHEQASFKARSDIGQQIAEGNRPAPPQNFNPRNDGSPQDPGFDPSAQQLQPGMQNSLQNQDINLGPLGTLKGSEYFNPQQKLQATAPIRASATADAASRAGAVTSATEGASEDIKKLPGGAYDQAKDLVGIKTLAQKEIDNANNDRALKIADLTGKRAENVANINSQSRITAANINAAARRYAADHKTNAKEIDPDEVSARAQQLRYSEGAPQGSGPIDRAAVLVNNQLGFHTISPKTLDNIKSLKPLEGFSTEMTDFANKYLGDGALSGLANSVKLNTPIASDEKNAFNQLLLNSTNIAKGVEGATGRILMAQIQVAKDFVANKNITKQNMLDNAKRLNDAVVTATEGQLGSLSPSQRVDYLDHHGFSTIAAYTAAKNKLAKPGVSREETKTNLLNDPNYEVVK